MDEQQGQPSRSRRPSGRDAKRAARTARSHTFVPYITRKIPYYEVLGTEGLELLEHNADTILEEIGIEFREDPEALQIFKDAGADVTGERVRFPRGMCRSIVQRSAPKEFVQYARNPARNVLIGGNNTVFAPAYGSPFVRNIDEGRRYARIEDFQNFVKLAYMANSLHHSGGTICEPVDLPVNKRHFDMVYSHMKYSDKPYMGSVTHPDRAQDTVEMTKILFGAEYLDPVTGKPKTFIISLINANSPMTFDATMLGALKTYARANQATIVTPFILAGAMSPVTVAGTVAQTLAEALAGMTLTQLHQSRCAGHPGQLRFLALDAIGRANIRLSRAGTRALRHGGPGAPVRCAFPLGRRFVRVQNRGRAGGLRIGQHFDSHLPGRSELRPAHRRLARGWALHGLREIRHGHRPGGAMHTLLAGVDLSENGQAMDAIREVGPGKHFLGCAHTQANFETAFYRSPLADNNSYEQWEAEGGTDMAQRANKLWKKQLAEYEVPPMDPAVDEALLDYMNRRKASFPDSNV